MAKRGRPKGSTQYPEDELALPKMADAIVAKRASTPYGAAKLFLAQVQGQSDDSKKKRLAGKYIKQRNELEEAAHKRFGTHEQTFAFGLTLEDILREGALLAGKSDSMKASAIVIALENRQRIDQLIGAVNRELKHRRVPRFTAEDNRFLLALILAAALADTKSE